MRFDGKVEESRMKEVQKYPAVFIYDKFSTNFKDNLTKVNCWGKIRQKFQKAAEENEKNLRFKIATTFGRYLNPISTGLFCLVVALGGGGGGWRGVFHPPSITPLSLKLDCSNFVLRYFQIG